MNALMKCFTLCLALLLPVAAQIKRPVRKSLLDNDARQTDRVDDHQGGSRLHGS